MLETHMGQGQALVGTGHPGRGKIESGAARDGQSRRQGWILEVPDTEAHGPTSAWRVTAAVGVLPPDEP